MPVSFLPSRVLGALLLLASVAPAPLLAAGGSYTGEAPVNSQSDQERSEALKTALANVVIAQSGDGGVLAQPKVASAVAQAERYVIQYQYRRNPGNGDDGAAKYTLVAQFDGAAVDQLLRRLGVAAGSGDASVLNASAAEATLWIGGLRNADDYARVVAYLARSNFLRSAQPTAARGDGVLVRVGLAFDLQRFLDSVRVERVLTVSGDARPPEGVDATLALAP